MMKNQNDCIWDKFISTWSLKVEAESPFKSNNFAVGMF